MIDRSIDWSIDPLINWEAMRVFEISTDGSVLFVYVTLVIFLEATILCVRLHVKQHCICTVFSEIAFWDQSNCIGYVSLKYLKKVQRQVWLIIQITDSWHAIVFVHAARFSSRSSSVGLVLNFKFHILTGQCPIYSLWHIRTKSAFVQSVQIHLGVSS